MSDRKLAQSAQMFHYQQQRQQMMAQEKYARRPRRSMSFMSTSRAHLDTKPLHSDDSDEDAPGVGDYTVYECPGLAPVSQVLSSSALMDSSRITCDTLMLAPR